MTREHDGVAFLRRARRRRARLALLRLVALMAQRLGALADAAETL